MEANQPMQRTSARRPNPGSVALPSLAGKLPPQAIELEEAVLGSLLIDRNALSKVIDILTPETFYVDAHQAVFSVVKDLFAESQPIDILTVAQALRKAGQLERIGGEAKLINLSTRVSSSAHIEYHARIVVQKHIQRELIRIASELTEKAYDESTDVLDLLDSAEQSLFSVSQGNLKRNYESSLNLVKQALDRISAISQREGLSGVPSGFRDVDRVTSGWQKSDLVILAARPGMGKTAFVLSMARNIAIAHKVPVAVFSLEMSSVQLITRMISSETGIGAEKLRRGNLDATEWAQLTSKVKTLQDAPIYIDDTPGLSIFDLRAKCRRLVSQHQIGIIIIDYLQLMTAGNSKSGGNREQEISSISRALKSIAKELDIPVIALSQLSRAVESREDKRPQLSDLRESGSIEQDADVVMFVYRDEYYLMQRAPKELSFDNAEKFQGAVDKWQKDMEMAHNKAELIIAKQRHGPTGTIKLFFEAEFTRFGDLDTQHDDGFAG